MFTKDQHSKSTAMRCYSHEGNNNQICLNWSPSLVDFYYVLLKMVVFSQSLASHSLLLFNFSTGRPQLAVQFYFKIVCLFGSFFCYSMGFTNLPLNCLNFL